MTQNNATRLKDGMAFNLSVGLQGVPLSPEERKGSGAKDMEAFSMVIAGQSLGTNFCRRADIFKIPADLCFISGRGKMRGSCRKSCVDAFQTSRGGRRSVHGPPNFLTPLISCSLLATGTVHIYRGPPWARGLFSEHYRRQTFQLWHPL